MAAVSKTLLRFRLLIALAKLLHYDLTVERSFSIHGVTIVRYRKSPK